MGLDDKVDQALKLILNIDELYELPPPEWVIENTIQKGSLASVFGPSGEGKTFTTIDMALHIAYGRRWAGLEVEQGGVLYVCGEGLSGIKARVKVWRDWHEGVETPPLYVTKHEIPFGDADAVAGLQVHLEDYAGKVSLVIVDTLHANFGPGNENSADDMGRFLAGLRKIQRYLEVAVAVVHHTGHENQHRARGHSSLKAALDTEIQVCKSEGNKDLVGITVTKQRNGSNWTEPKGFGFQVEDTGWFDNFGKVITSCVLVPDDAVPTMPGQKKAERKGGKLQQLARSAVQKLAETAPSFDGNGKLFISSLDLEKAMREAFRSKQRRYEQKKWLTEKSGILTPAVGGFTVDPAQN